MLQGEPAPPPVIVNDRSYTIRVRFPPATRATLESIRNTMLISGTGKTATIGSLAAMVEIPGQTEIRRENLQRNVQVTARFEDLNLGDGMAKVQKAVEELNLPPSIRVQYGGRGSRSSKTFKDPARADSEVGRAGLHSAVVRVRRFCGYRLRLYRPRCCRHRSLR